jgi:hypothetical protein
MSAAAHFATHGQTWAGTYTSGAAETTGLTEKSTYFYPTYPDDKLMH